jgi:hypothetical protein
VPLDLILRALLFHHTNRFAFSLKLKRPPVVKQYRQLLDELYAQAMAEESTPKAKL